MEKATTHQTSHVQTPEVKLRIISDIVSTSPYSEEAVEILRALVDDPQFVFSVDGTVNLVENLVATN